MPVGWQALIVGVISGGVGLAEVITRYRSDPGYAVRQPSAWFYVAVNAAAGVAALYIVRAFGWTFGQSHNVELWRILIAGFGAVALFRSSLFVTKVGGADVNVGPSLILGALLDTFDRSVDRKSAEQISNVIAGNALTGLDPEAVMSVLPVLCLALMQNFSPADQALLGTELVKTRSDPTLSPEAKMRAVTIQLAKYLGSDLVIRVLTTARSVFLSPPGAPVSPGGAAAVLEEARRLTAQGTAGQ